jgi:hypothetical protein
VWSGYWQQGNKPHIKGEHAVGLWVRHYVTSRKVAVSRPDELNLSNLSSRTSPLGLLLILYQK